MCQSLEKSVMDENGYKKADAEQPSKYIFLDSLRKNAIRKLNRGGEEKVSAAPMNKVDPK